MCQSIVGKPRSSWALEGGGGETGTRKNCATLSTCFLGHRVPLLVPQNSQQRTRYLQRICAKAATVIMLVSYSVNADSHGHSSSFLVLRASARRFLVSAIAKTVINATLATILAVGQNSKVNANLMSELDFSRSHLTKTARLC